jgi:hypothetical protein
LQRCRHSTEGVEHGFQEATALVGAKRRLALGGLAKPLAQVARQELSECREGHIFGDDASPTTGEAFLRWLANDVASPAYGLKVATTAALLAWRLDGNR